MVTFKLFENGNYCYEIVYLHLACLFCRLQILLKNVFLKKDISEIHSVSNTVDPDYV